METGIIILISIIVTVIYIIMGLGAYHAEERARSDKKSGMFTVFLWPIALGIWCFEPDEVL